MITVKLSTRFTCLVHNNRIRKIDVACKSWKIARFIIVHKERERERLFESLHDCSSRNGHCWYIITGGSPKTSEGNNSTNNIDRVRFFFTADFTTILSRVRFKWIDSRGQRNSSWSICESEMERVCSSNVSSNESTYVSSCLTMRNQVGNVFFLIKEKGSSSLGHGRKDGSCFVD